MKKITPILLSLILIAGCQPGEPKGNKEATSASSQSQAPGQEATSAASQGQSNSSIPKEATVIMPKPVEDEFKLVTAGDAANILVKESLDPTLRVDVLSSSPLTEGAPLKVELPNKEVLEGKYWAGIAPEAGRFEAIFLAYQELDFKALNAKLDEAIALRKEGSEGWERLMAEVKAVVDQFKAAKDQYYAANKDKVHSASYFLPLRPEKTKMDQLTDLKVAHGEDSYTIQGLDIKTAADPEVDIVVKGLWERETATLGGVPLRASLDGTFQFGGPLINRMEALKDLKFTGVSFQSPEIKLKRLTGRLENMAGETLWTKEYKEGEVWEIPNGSSLFILYDVILDGIKGKPLPQGNMVAYFNYEADGEKYATEVITSGFYHEEPLSLYLIERDQLDLAGAYDIITKLEELARPYEEGVPKREKDHI